MQKKVPAALAIIETRRIDKVARNKQFRAENGRRSKCVSAPTDQFYGPNSRKPDMAPDVLERLKTDHLRKLAEEANDRQMIELETRAQSNCARWKALRKKRLTASIFGIVCSKRPQTLLAPTIKAIVFLQIHDNAAMMYGRENEEMARDAVAAKLRKPVEINGFFIHPQLHFLGASPDGLIDDDGLVEIKCPETGRACQTEQEVRALACMKSVFDPKDPKNLKMTSNYYFQCQGQMQCTGRQYCIFAVWTPAVLVTIKLPRDDRFWENTMKPRLTAFYFDCMLPELLDSRYLRNMPIREPAYVLAAKEEARIKNLMRSQKRPKCSNNAAPKAKRAKLEVSVTTAAVSLEEIGDDPDNRDDADDLELTGWNDQYVMTDHDLQVRKQYLDEWTRTERGFESLCQNVLPIGSQLNDESLAAFSYILAKTTDFKTQNPLYIAYPSLITPFYDGKSLHILGGNCSNHWRCLFYDGTQLHVYDSLPAVAIRPEEEQYMSLRFPTILLDDIVFETVQKQPDGTSCGIYAAAFATTIALGGDPCKETYSKEPCKMRRHFVEMIDKEKLSSFPCE